MFRNLKLFLKIQVLILILLSNIEKSKPLQLTKKYNSSGYILPIVYCGRQKPLLTVKFFLFGFNFNSL